MLGSLFLLSNGQFESRVELVSLVLQEFSLECLVLQQVNFDKSNNVV